MPPSSPGSRRRWWWRVFRWCRVASLLLVLAAILAALYVQHVGVPEPFKAMVVGALLDRGLTVEFQRLRLLWYRGLVAERVKGRETGSGAAPQVEFNELTLNLDWSALVRSRVALRGLDFRGGRLTAPLQLTNEPPEDLVVEVPNARLRFGVDDTWSLDELTARCAGLTLSAHGAMTNGSAFPRAVVAALRPAARPDGAASSRWRSQLRIVRRHLAELRFSAPPQVQLAFVGDGRDLGSFRGEVRGAAGGVWTPWGELRRVNLLVRANPRRAASEHQRFEVRLDATDGATPWGSVQNIGARATVWQRSNQTRPERIEWELQAGELRAAALAFHQAQIQAVTTPLGPSPEGAQTEFTLTAGGVECAWGRSGELRVRGRAGHEFNRPLPETFVGEIGLARLAAGRLGLDRVQVGLDLRREVPPPASTAPELGFWGALAGVRGGFSAQAQGVSVPQFELGSLSFDGHWNFPAMRVTNLVADLCDGQLTIADARTDVVTRESAAQLTVDFDVQRLTNALPAAALEWLRQFEYATPPHAEATVRAVLPPWVGPRDEAALELRRSLDLRARLEGPGVSFKGLPATQTGVTVTISNDVLRLRDLIVVRPEGKAELSYELDLTRRDFRWRVDSTVDAHAAAPVLDSVLPGILALFEFSTPPRVSGEVWGNWRPPKQVEFALDLEAEGFRFRGEPFVALTGTLHKSGSQLAATGVRVRHATGEVTSASAGYEVLDRVVTLTNACARMDPRVIARCIGSELDALLEPYRFVGAPEVEVNGRVLVGRETAGSELTVEVESDAFQYWRFNTQKLAAVVRWAAHRVSVTNVACEFYGGRLSGEFILDLPPGDEPRFRFQARGTDFDLNGLLRDAAHSTNRIAGSVTGTLVVTNAVVSDWTSWQGYGQARLRDGVLWDLPIFGVLSRVMNLVVPGTGNSRATAAQGNYTITRSVIRTDNLEIDAGPARLQYAGTVDFAGNVDARVIAEVLHTTPLIGPFISLVLSPAAKALEFKITGTLDKPILKPLYVPGFLMPLLNPIGVMQDLIAPKPGAPGPGGR